MGTRMGCPDEPVRSAEFDLDPDAGYVRFDALSAHPDLEITLKFKPSTHASKGVLFVLTDETHQNFLASALTDEKLVVVSASGEKSTQAQMLEPEKLFDGMWHYMTVSRSASK